MDRIVKAEYDTDSKLWRVIIRPENNGNPYLATLTAKEYALRKLKEHFTERLSGMQLKDFYAICEMEREIARESAEDDFADRCAECKY